MSVKSLLLGGGSHARVLLSVLKEAGSGTVDGVVDPDPGVAQILQLPYLGDDGQLEGLKRAGFCQFLLGLGSTQSCGLREKLYLEAVKWGLVPMSLRHPAAWVSDEVSLGEGSQILTRAVLNGAVKLGDNVLVNTAAVIEHDCRIGDHSHVATGAILCGGVQVGRAVHIGAGAVIRQGLSLGDRCVVAAGAVVVKSVPPETCVMGVPARPSSESLV
ncbi:MAG: hypothetical protein HC904_04570 [Blastochloris sp.]|nr:hypothetical protein [Blastochloris sp.]